MSLFENHKLHFNTLPFLVIVFIISTFPRTTHTHTLTFTRSESETIKFNHLMINNNKSGEIFIGAVNWLYQLHPDLKLAFAERTGPEQDNPLCQANDECEPSLLRPTDNFNKILVIDQDHNQLISCGSVFQGICYSHDLKNITKSEPHPNEMVAANNGSASTVAFIAGGPPDPTKTNVMYVGASFTKNGPHRSDVPSVSSRSLNRNKPLTFASISISSGSFMYLSRTAAGIYPINFIYGFSSNGFSYFLTTQKRDPLLDSPYVSKIIRICQNDSQYLSYTEIPLKCFRKGMDYNLLRAAYVGKAGYSLAFSLGIKKNDDILFAVFSNNSKNKDEDSTQSQSAMCIYSLKEINRKFQQNIQNCFDGNGYRGLAYVMPDIRCAKMQFTIPEDFCGTDINTPLGGNISMSSHPVITFEKTTVTAVTATVIHGATVVFIGTRSGNLHKVDVRSLGKAFKYGDLKVDDSPVNGDLMMSPEQNYLYVMTERKLTRLDLGDCSLHKNCNDCLRAKDPFCGWCAPENKCSRKIDCKFSNDPLYWLHYQTGMCITITDIQPTQMDLNRPETIKLTITNLPTLIVEITCVFIISEEKLVIVNSTRTEKGLNCPLSPGILPSVTSNRHHYDVILSIRKPQGPDIVYTTISVVECKSYSSCTECVSSPYSCNWCTKTNVCNHNVAQVCENALIENAKHTNKPSGAESCPQIVHSLSTNSSEIIMSPNFLALSVKVNNLTPFMKNSTFACNFHLEGQQINLKANLTGDIINCETKLFTFSQKLPSTKVNFNIVWGDNSLPLDNPNNIHIVIHKCSLMANNCGLCLALPETYGCGWCKTSNSCEQKKHCNTPDSIWLDQERICPDPKIIDFHPKSGPVEGGTVVTIQGINLGKTVDDIRVGLTVADYECVPIDYTRSVQIVCKISEIEVKPTPTFSGPVKLKVKKELVATSQDSFTYLSPVIKDIKPNKGRISGGNEVVIMGTDFNIGNKTEAFIGVNPCLIIEISETYAVCIAPPSDVDGEDEKEFWMTFDGARRSLEDKKYSYTQDPTITSVESGPLKSNLRGIPSGGITIRVNGTRLDSVTKHKVYVSYNKQKYFAVCSVTLPTYMECPGPKIPVKSTDQLPLFLDLGFVMDEVAYSQTYNFSLYPDPKFFKFEEVNNTKICETDYITINGENIDAACKDSDIKVEIGTSTCIVTSISRSQLTCKPSLSDSKLDDDSVQAVAEVEVTVGGGLKFKIGYLKHCSHQF